MMYNHKNGITFDKISREALPSLLDLKEESWWGTHSVLMSSMEDQERWFNSLTNRDLVLGGFQNGEWIGFVYYSNIDYIGRTCDISGSVKKLKRKPDTVRFAFEAGVDFAFEMLNMHRLNAEVLSCNWPVQKLDLDHLEFRIEGAKREAVYKCGHYFDSIMIGLLRREWAEQKRVKDMGGSCNKTFHAEFAKRLQVKFYSVREVEIGRSVAEYHLNQEPDTLTPLTNVGQ